IIHGTDSTTVTRNGVGQRSRLTYQNGITVDYGYDVGGRLASLTFRTGLAFLGDLTYNYDLTDSVYQVGGSFARTQLPNPVSSTSYNSRNQLTQWGTSTLLYDANGNLASDGSSTYTWNARDQLVSVTGPV